MSIRRDKVSKIIKEEISLIFFQKIQDPKLGFVTVTEVKVTPDLKQAKVYFSVYEKNLKEEFLDKINDIKGFIRTELAHRLSLRYVPELFFYIDETLDYVEKMEDIFDKIHRDDKQSES